MTSAVAEVIAEHLRALGQPARVRLTDRLDLEGERSVGALAQELGMPLHSVSQHLAVLRSASEVKRRRKGREVLYRLSGPTTMRIYEEIAAGLLSESTRLSGLFNRED